MEFSELETGYFQALLKRVEAAAAPIFKEYKTKNARLDEIECQVRSLRAQVRTLLEERDAINEWFKEKNKRELKYQIGKRAKELKRDIQRAVEGDAG